MAWGPALNKIAEKLDTVLSQHAYTIAASNAHDVMSNAWPYHQADLMVLDER